MQYAREYNEFERRKARIVAISVDPPQRNAAMVAKLLLPFPLLSDPDGSIMQRYNVWDAEAKIAIPAIFVIDSSDTVRYVYRGHDFADRPGDQAVFDALDAASQPQGTAPEETQIQVTAADAQRPEKERKAVTLDFLLPYYRGAYFASVALKGRIAGMGSGCREGVRDIGHYQEMVQRYSKALQETATMKKEH